MITIANSPRNLFVHYPRNHTFTVVKLFLLLMAISPFIRISLYSQSVLNDFRAEGEYSREEFIIKFGNPIIVVGVLKSVGEFDIALPVELQKMELRNIQIGLRRGALTVEEILYGDICVLSTPKIFAAENSPFDLEVWTSYTRLVNSPEMIISDEEKINERRIYILEYSPIINTFVIISSLDISDRIEISKAILARIESSKKWHDAFRVRLEKEMEKK